MSKSEYNFEELTEKINGLSMKELKKYLDKEDIKLLHELKIYLDDLYYNTGDSILEDDKYDLIKDVLKSREIDYVPPVGAKLRQGENRVQLPYWLGSADKMTPEQENELEKWIQDNKSPSYIVSDKLDGVSCLLDFKDGEIHLYTRGDGRIGADISYLATYFKTIPKLKNDITVRGELILKKAVFDTEYKNQTIDGRQYKNPRNMVAGLIGGKTVRKGLESIDFVVYEMVGDSMPRPGDQLKKLKSVGFKVVKHESIKSLNMAELSKLLPRFRDESEYEIDGIIVQSDTPYDRNTSGNPDYLFAFKMLTEDAIHKTRVKSIEWNISKWGQLKPVVIVEPIESNGVTMTRATAHNAKYVLDNKLGAGAVIKITRSKEVIPYIVEVVKRAKEADMPEVEYVWDKNSVNITVKKVDDIMCVKLISGFFARLGIKHVSEATVSKMFANGLDNLLKIVGASKERLLQVPEFKEKSAERIYTNIHEGLKNVKLSLLLGASGVLGYGIGVKRIDALLLDIPDLLQVYKTKTKKEMIEMITSVNGFSDITADKIASNLKYAQQFVEKMAKYTTIREEKRVSESLKGQKIVMTGFRDKKLEQQITERGGKVVGSVSNNTTAIIVSEKTTKLTGKLEKAHKLGIPIYGREEFVNEFIGFEDENEDKFEN